MLGFYWGKGDIWETWGPLAPQLSVAIPSMVGRRWGQGGDLGARQDSGSEWVALFWPALSSTWDDCENTMKFRSLNYLTD